jgi:hypothetical protein
VLPVVSMMTRTVTFQTVSRRVVLRSSRERGPKTTDE